MIAEAENSPNADALISGREKVRIDSAPAWVLPCSYSTDFKAKTSGAVTHLLMDRQVQAEMHQMYVHMAVRLETMQAVQQHSQWRLEFLPLTQTILIHSVKIRRDNIEVECAKLDRIHFLQREAGLEGFMINGGITLLLLLEDVRPGDILEWSYTVENKPRLMPRSYSGWFPSGEGIQIGKYHLSVRFADVRQLRWKSSSPDLTPVENRHDGEVNWVWLRESFTSPEPEDRTPQWCLSYPWIQISDCPDWKTVANAFSEAWKKEMVSDELTAIVQQVTNDEPDIARQVNRAIQLVQDEMRYLSVNLELGGQVPMSASAYKPKTQTKEWTFNAPSNLE
jgi:hypothetical protein